MTPWVALAVSAAVALVAFFARALTAGGAAAASVVGMAVLWAAGWPGALVLGAFFVPSTLAGRVALARRKTSDPAAERRSAVQVFANGGAAAAGALLEFSRPGLGFLVMTCAFAAAAADTWATSVGAFSRSEPLHLVTRRRVPHGSSGGVTLLGTTGGVLGALIVAGTAALVTGRPRLLAVGGIVGVLGMLLDSGLGATVQARFVCPGCGSAGEKPRCECGSRRRATQGWPWLNNDGVNGLATLLSAGAGLLAWWLGVR